MDRSPSSSASSRLLRWQVSYGTFGVPQAAAPIAFALLALPLTGSGETGSAMVFAMTIAQVIGAVPLSRFGRRWNSVFYLRSLIAVRTVALAGMTVAAMLEGPLAWLVVTAFMAGITNGAAYGVQRALLNYLTTPDKLPRALGVAATLNEITFALSPVLASALGAISPVVAMIALTILGVGPLLLMPSIPEAEAEPEPTGAKRSALPPDVHIWLFCAAAGSAVVAGLEIGAVPFAIRFGLAPTWGFLFALALCVGSVTGGVWVSVRNRILTRAQVMVVLGITAAAAALAALSPHVALTLTAAFFIGLWLPLLGTYYSLVLDELSPPERRTEVFALMRTFNAVGIIIVSGVLALFGLELALMVSVIGIAACTVAVSLRFFGRSAPR